ncbi:hypothetical protein [Paenarthrobacter ureafaciens]|uniref:hypothetical protein n=1 Tax=Paenarthrobacter ureafaciens TaxID=37931 RepID=UPI00140BD306|nr:hypothetical protein [Paenarthrobacter ureafaciens]MCX8452809.1 hypothetical protein [Paenarthrobacter ureafaciens]MCY0971447.1 hypothetical protein [Paenarthrobacter ureafaciens]
MTDRPAIYLFPYLRLCEEVNVGPWVLQPLDPKKLAEPFDDRGRTLKALLSRFRDDAGQPLTTATLVQRKEPELDPGEAREHERNALQAAVLFAVTDANTGLGNEIFWDAPGLNVATAEVATLFVGELTALENGTFVRTRGGTLNRRIIGGGTVHDDFVVVPAPEGLVTIPDLTLDSRLLDAIYRVSEEALSDDSAKAKREVWAALHWHGRAWENSPLHSMPDILVQLKTAIEALSGKTGTATGISALEEIYRSATGTIGADEFLWRESSPCFSREYKGKTNMYSSFGHWYWYLADTRNAIVHDTESPVMEHEAAGSPFQGNLFRVAERVTRELIKIRLAQFGYPEAALSPSNRKHLRIAQSLGLQIGTISPAQK